MQQELERQALHGFIKQCQGMFAWCQGVAPNDGVVLYVEQGVSGVAGLGLARKRACRSHLSITCMPNVSCNHRGDL